LKIEPVTFTYKDGISGPEEVSKEPEIGVIAEQVEEIGGFEHLLIYINGTLESVRYEKLPVYLLEVCRKQQELIESLEARLSALENS
jgi:hypothetical protein